MVMYNKFKNFWKIVKNPGSPEPSEWHTPKQSWKAMEIEHVPVSNHS